MLLGTPDGSPPIGMSTGDAIGGVYVNSGLVIFRTHHYHLEVQHITHEVSSTGYSGIVELAPVSEIMI